jgi:aldehyde:ferredoxin oxidoreductase
MATVYLEMPAELFSLATGVEANEKDLLFAAKRAGTLERAFNVLRGIDRKDDVLPKRFFKVPSPGGPFKGEVLDKEQFNKMLDEYYESSGWDKNGVPKENTFKKYNMDTEWEYFFKKLPKEG